MIQYRSFLLSVLTSVLTACSDAAIERDQPLSSTLRAERPSEVVRIGSADASGLDMFVDIAQVSLGPDDRLYVLDRGRAEVLVFDQDGRPMLTIGGKGPGPGEFTAVSRFGFLGDTLWVSDRTRRTFSTFNLDGTFLDQRQPTLVIDSARSTRADPPLVLLSGGNALFETVDPAATLPPDAIGPVEFVNLVSLRRDTLVVRDVWRGRVPINPGVLNIRRIQTYPLVAWDPSGNILVVVHRAADSTKSAQTVRLTFLDGNGRTTRADSIGPFDLRPVSQADRDSIFDNATAALQRTIDRIERVRAQIRDARGFINDVLSVPDFFPLVADARVDQAGRVWLRLEDSTANRWLVRGLVQGELKLVDLAPTFEFHDAGKNHIWGTVRDSLRVEYVVGLAWIAR